MSICQDSPGILSDAGVLYASEFAFAGSAEPGSGIVNVAPKGTGTRAQNLEGSVEPLRITRRFGNYQG